MAKSAELKPNWLARRILYKIGNLFDIFLRIRKVATPSRISHGLSIPRVSGYKRKYKVEDFIIHQKIEEEP